MPFSIIRAVLALSLAGAVPGGGEVAATVERHACMEARTAFGSVLIDGLRLAKRDPEAAIRAIPGVVNAMFDFNAQLNARANFIDRAVFSRCVNRGLLQDIEPEVTSASRSERVRLRLYVEELRRQGAFESQTLAAKRAGHRKLGHDVADLGAMLSAGPGGVLFALGAAGLMDKSLEGVAFALAAWTGAAGFVWLATKWAGANDARATLHEHSIGYPLRACAALLASETKFAMPLVRRSPADVTAE